MKGIACLLVLTLLVPLFAATTVTIEGDASTATYALVLTGDVTAITLTSDGRISHTAVTVPLPGQWILVGKEDDIANHYQTLTEKRVQTLSLLHPTLAIHTLFDGEGMAGCSLKIGPLSLALFSFSPPAGDPLFINYRETWEGVAALARLKGKASFATVDWEVSYSGHRALSTTTSLSFEVGPFALTERFGPRVGQRELAVALSVKARGISCSLSFSTALGPDVIYSGDHQEKQTVLASSLSIPIGALTLEAGSEWDVRLAANGEEVRRHVWSLGLSASRWRCALRWRLGSEPTYSFSDPSARISRADEQISASFVHSEGPWQFTLRFSKGSVLSLLWRYTITMSRGSGSPRPS
ncbi:MAG: hypothetical protein ACOXZ7_01415 [Sphaerochaeta sp.]